MAGLDGAPRVVVPTRDSAGWIGAVLGAYDRLGVRPLFLVDSRSADGTRRVLEAGGADVAEVTPEANLVEDMVWRIPSVTDAAWILRFDDDEMPSRALLDWVAASALPGMDADQVAFPRRWCLFSPEGRLRYSRLEDFHWSGVRPDLLDPQSRLFRADRVRYVRGIHTAGFEPSATLRFAPADAFFCHFDRIVRGPAARLAKLRRYEREAAGGGVPFGRFYLPECLHPAELRETPFETDEFEDLARAFAAAAAAR